MPDKDDVIADIVDHIEATLAVDSEYVTIPLDLLQYVLALLKEQEDKQGKWERQYSRPGVYANLFWWCSVCGEPTRYNDAGIFYKYCPRCGAKLEPCIET